MNDQTTQLIRELAEKFGTTTEHLWGVLVAQAPITCGVNAVIIGSLLLVGASGLLVGWRTDIDEQPGRSVAGFALGGIFTLFGVCLTIGYGATIMSGFLNPEYWALMNILGQNH